MCESVPILDTSKLLLGDVAYKLVRMCAIFGYVPDDITLEDEFKAVLSGDSGGIDVVSVMDEAINLLNMHSVEKKRYILDDDNVLRLYSFCFDFPECRVQP